MEFSLVAVNQEQESPIIIIISCKCVPVYVDSNQDAFMCMRKKYILAMTGLLIFLSVVLPKPLHLDQLWNNVNLKIRLIFDQIALKLDRIH